MRLLLSFALLSPVVLLPSIASADEACSGVRVDADASCEQRVEVGCSSSCDVDDVLLACAADLAASCRAECDLDADIQCTGDCTATCEQRCAVDDVVCDEECADECATTCVDQCTDADDPQKCRASCESTCGAECDVACGKLPVDASCFEHCEECCFGSCTAQINFDCQIGCQASAFTQCEELLTQECSASCGVGGTVYCDGQYVAGGDDVAQCTDALEDRGIEVDVKVDVLDPREGLSERFGSCAVDPGPSRNAGWLAVLLAVGLVIRPRRRR